jgi:hypothetical protein
MTWTATPYCTLSDVKMSLDPDLDTRDDAFLNSLILQAQADIDREIGYMFQQDGTTSAPATRYYDGSGRESLPIDDLVSLYGGGGCSPTPCGAVVRDLYCHQPLRQWHLVGIQPHNHGHHGGYRYQAQ